MFFALGGLFTSLLAIGSVVSLGLFIFAAVLLGKSGKENMATINRCMTAVETQQKRRTERMKTIDVQLEKIQEQE